MASDSPWSSSEALSSATPDSHEPALATVSEAVHLVWNKDRVLYHAIHDGTAWSSPLKVAVGEQPVVAATADGTLHCLFANRFLGNYEIYHVMWSGGAWSLPQPVSRTSGVSTNPAVAVGPDGTLYAVWADTTPGYPAIFYGKYDGTFWSSVPIPSGRGSMPSLAVTPDGALCVVWQDRISSSNCYDVFSSTYREATWSVPEIVSDTPTAHSVQPRVTANAAGKLYMVWQEQQGEVYSVRFADRHSDGWNDGLDISTTSTDNRLPAVMTNRQGYIEVVWLEGSQLRHRIRSPEDTAIWWPTESASSTYPQLSDLALTISPTGSVHVVVSGFVDSTRRRLFSSEREPVFKHTVFQPIT